ncbi:hypothetical protein B9479_001437 [Cryptococcus floricola]|uniref:Uncharacterized protein n=1 Tax=Cryptococcus floricola TaxID=2591691 RepID=A0A5D3B278_9TREE|nr:hypothetical protein B9479_001437 [Cryptococcus floricola]
MGSRDRSKSRDRDSSHRHGHRTRSISPRRDHDRGDKHRSGNKEDEKSHRRDSYSRRDSDRRSRKRERRREATSSSEEETLDLKEMGVAEITESDDFLKYPEFKRWLRDDRGKYLDELPTESGQKYFRRFVRRWNDGALDIRYYKTSSSRYRTDDFGDHSSVHSREGTEGAAFPSVRPDHRVTSVRPERRDAVPVGPSLPSSLRPLGPSIPSAADRQFAHEASRDARKLDRKAIYKDQARRADDEVPKSGGREGRIEERRAVNAENRLHREKDTTAGLEVDEKTLMGDSNSFAAALRRRDEAEARRREKKEYRNQDQRAAVSERLSERKTKEDATMEMFKQMAKQRFG